MAEMAELNFIILKINGVDINNLPQSDTVQTFLTASTTNESILLEVKHNFNVNIAAAQAVVGHEHAANNTCTATTNARVTDIAKSASDESTKLDTLVLENNQLILRFKPQMPENIKSTQTDDCLFDINNQAQHQHQIAKEAADQIVEDEHHLFEQCLAPEIDVEEITLRKSDSNERLGLTVCYSNSYMQNGIGNNNTSTTNNSNDTLLFGSDENEAYAEIYISNIHPDSIAGRDGRLRQGDQILQINGKDIKTKEETEALIAENNNAVTLLVSRYLYADDDDFNDPSVAELEVEEDEDDEDEDDEFYDENNLSYENCFISSKYIDQVEELDKALLAQASQQQAEASANLMVSAVSLSNAQTTTISNTSNINTLLTTKPANIGKNQKIIKGSELLQTENVTFPTNRSEQQHKVKPNFKTKQTSCTQLSSRKKGANMDYDTEHIYETIPEDSESEPFYCSPYESSMYVTALGSCSSSATSDALQQQKRVAQWLGIKPSNVTGPTTMVNLAPRKSNRTSSDCARISSHDASSVLTRNRCGTVRSALTNGSSSSGGNGVGAAASSYVAQTDEHDNNSSSAYNSGGSNNSATVLVINKKNRSDTLPSSFDDENKQTKDVRSNSKTQRLLKDSITSPKNTAALVTRGKSNNINLMQSEYPPTVKASDPALLQEPLISSKTNQTNDANFQQSVLLQQNLVRHALTQHQKPQLHIQSESQYCPQFTAPNLSKYHFVSSQQVSAAHMPTTIENVVPQKNSKEETMVWKVKRRPDGTRYIVRRPVRSRLLRERAERINTERVRNEITTTEEDTISEIKTGRYWTKEERKKHFERARERRQQHQQQHHLESSAIPSMLMSTMQISEKTCNPQQLQQNRDRVLQYQDNVMLRRQDQLTHTRWHCQNSAKTLQQHCQLQLNWGGMPPTLQQQQQFMLYNANISSTSCPMKSASANAHVCSGIDTAILKPQTAADSTETVSYDKSGANNLNVILKTPVSAQQTQNDQSPDDVNNLNIVL